MIEYITNHIGEIGSMVTIFSGIILGFRWLLNSFVKQIGSIHKQIESIHRDIEKLTMEVRDTNKRIDALYHYVLTKSELK